MAAKTRKSPVSGFEHAKALDGARPFATPKQLEALDHLAKHGTYTAAAEVLGVSAEALRQRLNGLGRYAARRGWSPGHDMNKPTPEGYHVKGTSTLYDAEGNTKIQWVKTQADQKLRISELMDACSAFADEYSALSPTVESPSDCMADLLAVYPLGDPHLGMFSWHEETGEDFDLKIAERNLLGAMVRLVDLAPAAEHALIVNLGDFFHADSPENRTARAGNALDVDSRWGKVLRIGIKVMIQLIVAALAKHKYVTVICEIGNHDDMSSQWLAAVMDAYFSNNDRVTIDQSPATFHWYEFGSCFFGTTHGNNNKLAALPEIMAARKPAEWGRSRHRKWYVGHVHHDQLKEYRGCSVGTYRTLAPADAWHSAQGYISNRDAKVHVWHKEHGLISSQVVALSRIFGSD